MLARTQSMSIAVRDLLALAKPRLSGQVVFTAGAGLLLAPTSTGWFRGLVAVIATAVLVGAANALNAYIERSLDRMMSRTMDRPLATGRLAPWIALAFAFPLAGVALAALAVVVNPMTACLGLLALLTYVLVYTPMKVRSPMALWVGAVPGAIPPFMGWTAAQGQIEWGGMVLFGILFCWQIPHFIAIGVYRKDEYANAGFKILPLCVSARAVKIHAIIWSALLVPLTLALGPLNIVRPAFAVGAALMSAGFAVYTALGLRTGTDDTRWSWSVFRTSLVYLTSLFALLGFGAWGI